MLNNPQNLQFVSSPYESGNYTSSPPGASSEALTTENSRHELLRQETAPYHEDRYSDSMRDASALVTISHAVPPSAGESALMDKASAAHGPSVVLTPSSSSTAFAPTFTEAGSAVEEPELGPDSVLLPAITAAGSPRLAQRLSRFHTEGAKDTWAALVLLAWFVTCIVWGCVNMKVHKRIIFYNDTTLPDGEIVNTGDGEVQLAHGLGIWSLTLCMCLTSVVSVATVLVVFVAVATRPTLSVVGVSATSTLAMLLAGVLFITQGSIVVGVLVLLLSPFPVFWFLLGRQWVPLTAAFLDTSARVVQRRSRTYVAACAALVALLVVFTVFWSCTAYPFVDRIAADSSGALDYILFVVFILVLLWVGEVCSNLLCLITCEMTAMWYYAGRLTVPDAVYEHCWWRASTSAGSVCLGSTLQWMMQYLFIFVTRGTATEVPSVFSFLARRVVGCVEPLVRYFNHYALVQVAVYGSGYTAAAKRTWALMQQCWLTPFCNNGCLINPMFTSYAFGVGTLVGAVVFAIAHSAVFATVAFWLTFVEHCMLLAPLRGCVLAIFVCYAESPAALQEADNKLYRALRDEEAIL